MSSGWDVLNRAKNRAGNKPEAKKKDSGRPVKAAKGGSGKTRFEVLQDRCNALQRNERYRREWETAFADYLSTLPPDSSRTPDINKWPFLGSSQGKKLAQRWGLGIAPHPDYPNHSSLWNLPDNLILDQGRAVIIIRHGHMIITPEDKVDLTPHLENKRYLTLRIDLWKPKTQALNEISLWLDYYRPMIGKKKTRGSAIKKIIWKVYDLHHKEGKSLLAITRELFPEVGNEDPNIDRKTKRKYERVQEYYRTAKALIDNVSPLHE